MSGPHLAIAVLCEKVLTEQDGVLSVIRVIDRVTVSSAGPDVPEAMPPTQVSLSAVVSFRSGSARGRYTVRLRPEDPSGMQLPALEMPVHFEGEERGANLVISFNFLAEHEGLYWIDVLFQEDVVTRIPLRVIYQPQRFAAG